MSKKKKKIGNKVRLKRHRKKEAEATLKDKIVEKGFWGIGVATTAERQNALESEQKAIRFLGIIKSSRIQFSSIGVITEVVPSRHLDWDDKRGIDIMVRFSSGKSIFIDVKNSGSLDLMEYMSNRNRCLLVIPWDVPDENGVRITIGTIKWWFGLFSK